MTDNRTHDIVIYGATGYTGQLVAEYLAQKNGQGLRWAMAGRSGDKLEAVRAEIGAPESTPLIEADANDPESVRRMVADARCIITTVGPYQSYGSGLVAAGGCDLPWPNASPGHFSARDTPRPVGRYSRLPHK